MDTKIKAFNKSSTLRKIIRFELGTVLKSNMVFLFLGGGFGPFM